MREAITYEKAVEKFDNLDVFLQNKIKFFESKPDLTESSKVVMWRIFNKVHVMENMFNKDLALFNEDDVKMLLSSIVTGTNNMGKSIKSVVNQYEIWALSTGLNPASNPCDSIDLKEVMNPVRNVIQNSIISIDELFDLWDYIQTKPNAMSERVTIQNFAAILLMRVGLKGNAWSEVLYLKEEDIDFENGIINVTNRNQDVVDGKKQLEVIKSIAVEQRVLDVLKEAIETKGYYAAVKKKKTQDYNMYITFRDRGYVIKLEEGEDGKQLNTFQALSRKFFEAAGRDKIANKDIYRNAKLDMLFAIRETKDELEVKDVRDVQSYFEPYSSASSYTTLKEVYEAITGEKVHHTTSLNKTKEHRRKYQQEYYKNVVKKKREE